MVARLGCRSRRRLESTVERQKGLGKFVVRRPTPAGQASTSTQRVRPVSVPILLASSLKLRNAVLGWTPSNVAGLRGNG